MMSEFKAVFENNLQRVDSLVAFYAQIKKTTESNKFKDYYYTDMLRAATVFLHSSFEEYYRNVLTTWLPIRASSDSLKNIPLPNDVGRNQMKYALADLLHMKEKTVREIFQESIQAFMNRSSFNSYSDVYTWGNKINLSFTGFEHQSDFDKAIQRRHQIVHQADIKVDSVQQSLIAIKQDQVLAWREAYRQLVEIIDSQIDNWHNTINDEEEQ